LELDLDRTETARRLAIAHLAEDGREHALSDHLEAVGHLAGLFAEKWGARAFGEVAGNLHDLGKYAEDFQAYIRSARDLQERRDAHIEGDAETPEPRRGRVDHSSAGALKARELYGHLGELLAFVIAGHHAGLADREALQGRLQRKLGRLPDALAGSPPLSVLEQRLPLDPPYSTAPKDAADAEQIKRRLELWTRMLFSALCDADFLDTEAFFDRTQTTARAEARSPSLADLLASLTAFVAEKERLAAPTEVNSVRREVRQAAAKEAEGAPGVFTLTVPTGGGKTLTGMEFALRHALANGLDRVVIAIPFTSIIEQNAEVYRAAFGSESVVLEHHASFDPQRETARSRLASQNWDVPIVVTTTVQLFESLFARRTSRCRKLHNLARSVIVLDEAQTMPPSLLEPTLEVLESLVRDYGASLVISTATQPAFARESLGHFGFEVVREIAPPSLQAFERLRRVDVRWPTSFEGTPYTQLAVEIAGHEDVLAITHRRADARRLTELLDERLGDDSTVHLSALMCAEHRSGVLRGIRQRKKDGKPVRVVSTQLVEAGVDLDFPVVYRALAGLDSLAQAAGRCNREGALERGELRVFVAETAPPPGVLTRGQRITEGMLRADPALDLSSSAPHRTYFERLYTTGETDKKAIQAARARLNFQEVAGLYKLIEDDWSEPVIVRFGRASDLLEGLERFGPSRDRLRALGRFSVNVPKRLVAQWIAAGAAERDDESGVVQIAEHVSAYDDRFGLVPERVGGAADIRSLIIDG
jgi:CRISPR-associated endonuclease/helicase Cas3